MIRFVGKLYNLLIEIKFSLIVNVNELLIISELLINVNSIESIIKLMLNIIIIINNIVNINFIDKLNISFDAKDVT